MSLSRKDYIAVAAAIRRQKRHLPPDAFIHQIAREQSRVDIADELARVFAKDNELFDREMFLSACGV